MWFSQAKNTNIFSLCLEYVKVHILIKHVFKKLISNFFKHIYQG